MFALEHTLTHTQLSRLLNRCLASLLKRAGLMVKQHGATCPGHPGGVVAGLSQARHRSVRGVELAGGVGYGASAEELRSHSPAGDNGRQFSAQAAAGHAATLGTSGGGGSPPWNFTKLTGGDLTADTNPAEGELLSPSSGGGAEFSTHGADCELQFAPSVDGGVAARDGQDGRRDSPDPGRDEDDEHVQLRSRSTSCWTRWPRRYG